MVHVGRHGDPPEGSILIGTSYVLPWNKTITDYKKRGDYLVPKDRRKCRFTKNSGVDNIQDALPYSDCIIE